MTRREKPGLPEEFGRPEWDSSQRHQSAVAEYIAYLNEKNAADEGSAPHEPDLASFTDEEVMYIVNQASRQVDEPFDPREFRRAMTRTIPAIVMPKLTSFLADLYVVMAQPEMHELFLPYWTTEDEGSRGTKPGHSGTRALMLMAVFLGQSAHMLQNYWSLASNARMLRLFTWAEARAAEAAGKPAAGFRLSSYSASMKHIKKLSHEASWHLAMKVNIVMVRAIHVLRGVDELRLLIDGTDVAAWCRQVGKTHKGDAQARAMVPEAGARSYAAAIMSDEGERQKRGKFWRGYYCVALVDQATGRPLVWTLRNADWDEARALQELLYLLDRYWPEARPSVIVGDAAWNEPWAYKLCAEYGIDLIARRSKHSLSHGIVVIPEKRSKRIAAVDRKGIAYCRRHNDWENDDPAKAYTTPMKYVGVDRTTSRVRYLCDHGTDACGKVGISMSTPDLHNADGDALAPLLSYQLFTYYPTTMEGRPDLQAMRVALLARRNQIESLFSSLKVAGKLGLQGASRTRLAHFDSVRMLISLQFLTRTAFMLAAARIEAGEFSSELPAELDGGGEHLLQEAA